MRSVLLGAALIEFLRNIDDCEWKFLL